MKRERSRSGIRGKAQDRYELGILSALRSKFYGGRCVPLCMAGLIIKEPFLHMDRQKPFI